MAIRPIDVRRKEFRSSFRGYDANQVDDFLDAVADEFERAYTENERMREEISGLRARLDQFEELEGSIRSALVHAEQAANDLRESARREAESLRSTARREAELTVQEAKARSHQMLADSSARVERVKESYEALQEAKRKFSNDFRQLLKTYTDMLEKMEISTAREIEASLRDRLDLESIAVAREAAEQEEAGVAEESTQRLEAPPEDPQATQRIEPEEMDLEQETASPASPEAEEPEVEPSTAGDEGVRAEQRVPREEENTAAEEVDREEPGPLDESRTDEFFDRGTTGREEEEGGNRFFRASRFLRRREQ